MTTEIKVCMGSACFAKGNNENIERIKQYIDENGLDAEIIVSGTLCADKCGKGPRIIVNGIEYENVGPQKLEVILKGENQKI